jgi:CBS domain-containing protein
MLPPVTARDIMTSPVVTVSPTDSLETAARMMLEQRIGCVLVVNKSGDLEGIITQSDFTAKNQGVPFSLYRFPKLFGEFMPQDGVEDLYRRARTMPVGDIMNRAVSYVGVNDDVETIVRTMLRTGYHRIPVVDNGKPVGIIARHDLLRLMVDKIEKK